MSSETETPARIPDVVLVLDGQPCKLVWDRGAMFRADEVGAWSESTSNGLGFSQSAKLLWSMLPPERRQRWRSPEDVAAVMPDVMAVRTAVDQAMSAAKEDMDPKNVFGSTNGHGASSS